MENGQITIEQMKTIFAEYEQEIKSNVGNQITLLRREIPMHTQQELQAPTEDTLDNFGVPFADGELDKPQAHSSFCFRNFVHNGRFWCVPESFHLPSRIKLRNGWRLWLQGLLGFQIEDKDNIARAAPIRSLRKFTNTLIPPETKKRFFHWCPIFKAIEETPGLDFQTTRQILMVTFLQIHFRMPCNI